MRRPSFSPFLASERGYCAPAALMYLHLCASCHLRYICEYILVQSTYIIVSLLYELVYITLTIPPEVPQTAPLCIRHCRLGVFCLWCLCGTTKHSGLFPNLFHT